MSLKETESLVLKSYNLAEADRIVVFLTQDHGVVRGVAKGAKRLKSRFGGSLEPFTIGKLSYFQKDAVELVSIRQLDLIESYFGAAAQPDFLQKFAYLSELLLAMTPPQDPQPDLYRMFKACLSTGAEQPDTLTAIGLYFELWLLRLQGYLPNWKQCSICRTTIPDGQSADLQSTFQLVCNECRRTTGAVVITPQQRLIFKSAQTLSPSNFVDKTVGRSDDILAISMILRRVISTVIGRDVTPELSLSISVGE